MKISIIGKPKNTKKSSIRYAAKFFANELLSKRLSDNILVRIVFDKNIIAEDLSYHDDGSCMFTLFEETGFPREFEILIRPSLSRADTYMVLAHEMSHVEQYARGRLHFYQRDSDRARWKNKVYKSTIKSLKEYLRKPWEIEATKMEEKLIEALYLHLKENNQ